MAADGEVEPADEGIRVLLFQAVRELLYNVVQHAQVKNAWVEINRLDDEQVRIVVRDNGLGFDPGNLAISALGLFGFREIAADFEMLEPRERLELLGGKLDVTSSLGKGTSISIVAPYRSALQPSEENVAAARSQAAPSAISANAPPHPTGGKPIRVLLADDHPILRKNLANILRERTEIEVVDEAGDGQEAVEMALQNRPHVVLMDVSMPRMDGIAATRLITAQLPEVRVIGLSMHTENDMRAAMCEAGAVDYLTKGLPATSLMAAIFAQVGERRG